MLLIKRLATSVVLFGFLFVVFFIGALVVGGAMAGERATRDHPEVNDFQSGYSAGHQAGVAFGKKYGKVILQSSIVFAGGAAFAISFSGLLPWCRKATQPKPLPLIR